MTDIVEKYNLVKRQKGFGSSLQKQNLTMPSLFMTPQSILGNNGQVISHTDQNSALATAGDDDPSSFVIKEMNKLKR